jgi:hypothetical protein
VLRFLAIALVVFAVASCDSGSGGPTTTTSSTTTTIDNDTCERVGDDTVAFVNALVSQLDGTRLAEFRDRDRWSDDLVDLDRAGRDLDLRVNALGCDPDAIRQQALERSDLIPEGPLSAGLIDVLLNPPTTTTTTVAETTTTTVAETTTTTFPESTSSTEGSTTTSDG